MKKKNYALVFSLCFVSFAMAQDITEETKKKKETLEIKTKKNAMSVSLGMPGIGIEYSRKLSNKFSARAKYNFFKLDDYKDGSLNINGNDVEGTASVESSTIDVLVEYLPFKNSSFKLLGGFGIINKMDINLIMDYDQELVFGDLVLDKDNFGNVTLDFSWKGVAPYLGMGFGRAIPKGKYGFGIEVGTYFSSSPDINLTATKLLAATADQEAEIEQTFESWKFIPLLQFRLAYAF